ADAGKGPRKTPRNRRPLHTPSPLDGLPLLDPSAPSAPAPTSPPAVLPLPAAASARQRRRRELLEMSKILELSEEYSPTFYGAGGFTFDSPEDHDR
ncbi:MAG: hypothetical protein ACRELD_02350, partial [Longimicrobiales bacterium]